MSINEKKSSLRKTSIIVGALFLIAMVVSLAGGIWVENIISAPDYLSTVPENETQLKIGVFLEFMNALAVVGIGMLMVPILKKHSETIAFGYLGLRIMEAIFYVGSAIIPLSILSLSQEYGQTAVSDPSYFQIVGTAYIAEHAQLTGLLVPVFMGLGALLLYGLLYQAKLIPRFISVWGFIAAILMITANVFEFGMNTIMLLVLPLILNEIFLGIWLIVKGFNAPPIGQEPTKTVMSVAH
ncbi:DUF4386 domain-containing protein [Candidatus Leptofilum sp.]|uniref:DUF4386 domain-containing protein n=1 Tax=Candidatus Leptofilum sp. TaxID=3241576 RepID=UPI003B5B71BD